MRGVIVALILGIVVGGSAAASVVRNINEMMQKVNSGK